MAEVYHALGLNMHQPLGNLIALHNSNERWEARQILWAYDRPVRMLSGYEDIARLHISFSGTLLKQFEDPAIRETFHDVIDVEDLLASYQRSNIEFTGSALYHCVYPLVPSTDWDAQTGWWKGLGEALLGRNEYRGFWPPEMGFCMEMIPTLKRHGYQYVLVDCWYIKPKRDMRWEEIRYKPHIACYGGEEIVVIPRDRELSNAQLSGLDPGWFQHEVYERTKHCDFPALVTTWTDGDNGGWFRTVHVNSGFWGHFYHKIFDQYRSGTLGFTPIHISDFLDRFPPTDEVDVVSGAWNTGHHWGGDFCQWTGSLMQRNGWNEISNCSAYYQNVKKRFDETAHMLNGSQDDIRQIIIESYDHLLAAETSCNFFWGSAWVHKAFGELEKAYSLLDLAMARLNELGTNNIQYTS